MRGLCYIEKIHAMKQKGDRGRLGRAPKPSCFPRARARETTRRTSAPPCRPRGCFAHAKARAELRAVSLLRAEEGGTAGPQYPLSLLRFAPPASSQKIAREKSPIEHTLRARGLPLAASRVRALIRTARTVRVAGASSPRIFAGQDEQSARSTAHTTPPHIEYLCSSLPVHTLAYPSAYYIIHNALYCFHGANQAANSSFIAPGRSKTSASAWTASASDTAPPSLSHSTRQFCAAAGPVTSVEPHSEHRPIEPLLCHSAKDGCKGAGQRRLAHAPGRRRADARGQAARVGREGRLPTCPQQGPMIDGGPGANPPPPPPTESFVPTPPLTSTLHAGESPRSVCKPPFSVCCATASGAPRSRRPS
jgi:hypothetical protein